MGACFEIHKLDSREFYSLGKPLLGSRSNDPAPDVPARPDDGDRTATSAWLKAAITAIDPGFSRLWSIMGNENHVLFTLGRDDQARVAASILHGAQGVETPEQAATVARDLIAWAGDSRMVLTTDGDLSECGHLGFDVDEDGTTPGRRETGSLWNAMGGV